MKPTKITLCPARTACPELAITDSGVTIDEDANTVRLSHAEWHELARLVAAVGLRQKAELIAAHTKRLR